jgi:glutathione peroxidase-family protein
MTWVLSLLLSSSFAAPPAPAPEVSVPSALASLSLVRLDGSPLPAAELAGKVVLFVNVASKCGYTPQYDGLEKLYAAHKARGLVIVGVPCNQFGGQEPGAPEEIATFCKLNYGVTFPLLEKQDVNGSARSPLYGWLVSSPASAGADVKWNFEKFLVGRDGKVVARFPSKVAPDAAELTSAIDRALAGT